MHGPSVKALSLPLPPSFSVNLYKVTGQFPWSSLRETDRGVSAEYSVSTPGPAGRVGTVCASAGEGDGWVGVDFSPLDGLLLANQVSRGQTWLVSALVT